MVIWMNFTSLGNGADKGGSTLSKLGSNSTAQLYPKVAQSMSIFIFSIMFHSLVIPAFVLSLGLCSII